uniref:Uncharacterized protein n=1 Tax=Tanacetum cinerariifolium TaxID=118510 RepID=A0A6L2MMW2_TANCI|nr:hypothetical protein [Tanacetum cinerariifolium]
MYWSGGIMDLFLLEDKSSGCLPLIFTHGQPSSVEDASVQPAQSEPAFAKGPSVEPVPSVPTSDNAAKKKGKRTRSEPNVPFRIYPKNKGRRELETCKKRSLNLMHKALVQQLKMLLMLVLDGLVK